MVRKWVLCAGLLSGAALLLLFLSSVHFTEPTDDLVGAVLINEGSQTRLTIWFERDTWRATFAWGTVEQVRVSGDWSREGDVVTLTRTLVNDEPVAPEAWLILEMDSEGYFVSGTPTKRLQRASPDEVGP